MSNAALALPGGRLGFHVPPSTSRPNEEAVALKTIFFINLLPGAVMFAKLWSSLDPAARQFGLLRRGDWIGIVTIAVGLGSLETVLEKGEKDDWFGSPFIVRLSIAAGVNLLAFTVIQLSLNEPLLNLRLLARRYLRLGTVANFFFGLSMYGWIYVIPRHPATRTRLDRLASRFMSLGVSDSAFARHEALVAVGRVIRRQAFMLAYSDTIIEQAGLLALALLAVLLLKRAATGPSGEAH
jgi:hypothetical protein